MYVNGTFHSPIKREVNFSQYYPSVHRLLHGWRTDDTGKYSAPDIGQARQRSAHSLLEIEQRAIKIVECARNEFRFSVHKHKLLA